MELFAIILSIPVAFVASLGYCLVLAAVVVRIDALRGAMWAASVAILALCAIEVVLLATVGPVRSRATIGPAFYILHLALVVLGTPALANLIVLWRRQGLLLRSVLAVPLCTVFAFCWVLLQYGVSEALYGVDGTQGPYSPGP